VVDALFGKLLEQGAGVGDDGTDLGGGVHLR
jgi:hypothetical protein